MVMVETEVVLQVEPIGLSDRLNVGNKEKIGIKDDA